MAVKTTESGATYRNRLSRSIVLAIRLLMQQNKPDGSSLDKAAFVVLALEKITESVNTSAEAWEKRDYWVKADHFRLEWSWVDQSRISLEKVVLTQNWPEIARELIQVAQHLRSVQISANNRIGEPWEGAWELLSQRT